MNTEEIIDMARQAGFPFNKYGLLQGDDEGEIDADAMFEAFAKLVDAKATAREREACAKLAETPIGEYEVVVACGTEPTPHRIHRYLDSDSIAKAIRNRGDL